MVGQRSFRTSRHYCNNSLTPTYDILTRQLKLFDLIFYYCKLCEG